MARLLRVAALLSLAGVAAGSPSHLCRASFAGDALLRRVDDHLTRCLPPAHARAADAFQDALVTNELDATQRRPLAVVAVASSAAPLDRFAAALATALAGTAPDAPLAVRELDLAAAVASSQPAHETSRALRRHMAAALAACATQRVVVVVRGLARVGGAQLPLLDVFLDPLNGERALLRDDALGDLDARRALFVFLYEQKGVDASAWRDDLVATWRASAAAAVPPLSREAFTPQALVGRLTTAVVFPDNVEDDRVRDAAWAQACELDAFLARRSAAAASPHTTSALGGALLLPPSQTVAVVLGLAVLVVGAVLVSAKAFVARSKHHAARVEVLKAAKSRKRQQRRRASQAQPDPERIASLRSHGTVAKPVAPASPELTPVAEPQTASPDRKTPTPTKPKRTGRARKASASTTAPTGTKMATRQSRRA